MSDLGIKPRFKIRAFPAAGPKSPDKGIANLEMAVSNTAFLPAAFDFPYETVPSAFNTSIPFLISFYLMKMTLLAPAKAQERYAMKALTKTALPLDTVPKYL